MRVEIADGFLCRRDQFGPSEFTTIFKREFHDILVGRDVKRFACHEAMAERLFNARFPNRSSASTVITTHRRLAANVKSAVQ